MPRAAAASISAWLVVPQSTVTMSRTPSRSAASSAASERPCPSSRRLGTYGSAEIPYRARARTRIARPVRPSASKSPNTMTRAPSDRATARRSSTRSMSGSRPGSLQGVQGIREPGGDRRAIRHAPGDQHARHPVRESARRGRRRDVRRQGDMVRERPSVAGLDHVHQDATRRCTAALRACRRGGVRRRTAALGARARYRDDRADGSPRGASRRAAGQPRRSTSTSPRRCR